MVRDDFFPPHIEISDDDHVVDDAFCHGDVAVDGVRAYAHCVLSLRPPSKHQDQLQPHQPKQLHPFSINIVISAV